MYVYTENTDYTRPQYEYELEFHRNILAESNFERRKAMYLEGYRYSYDLSLKLAPEPVDFGCQSEEITLLAPFLEGKDIIDYGCGYGSSTFWLAQYAKTVVGCDILPVILEKAQERLTNQGCQDRSKHAPGNITFRQVEPASLDFPMESADVVYASDVIEHMHPVDALNFMRQVHDVLRPGGLFVCITPHRFYGPSDISAHFLPKGAPSEGFHLKEYGYGDLTAMVRDAGFSDVRTPALSPRHAVRLPAYRQLTPLLWQSPGLREVLETLVPVKQSRLLRKIAGLNRAVYLLARKA